MLSKNLGLQFLDGEDKTNYSTTMRGLTLVFCVCGRGGSRVGDASAANPNICGRHHHASSPIVQCSLPLVVRRWKPRLPSAGNLLGVPLLSKVCCFEDFVWT